MDILKDIIKSPTENSTISPSNLPTIKPTTLPTYENNLTVGSWDYGYTNTLQRYLSISPFMDVQPTKSINYTMTKDINTLFSNDVIFVGPQPNGAFAANNNFWPRLHTFVQNGKRVVFVGPLNNEVYSPLCTYFNICNVRNIQDSRITQLTKCISCKAAQNIGTSKMPTLKSVYITYNWLGIPKANQLYKVNINGEERTALAVFGYGSGKIIVSGWIMIDDNRNPQTGW